jgi:uracil-DNA glycosylase family 4
MPKITTSTLSPFQQHVFKWKNCRECPLCETRTKIVFARGTIPAPVVFCGEAPGPSEDFIGQPFVGPAGDLMNQMIKRAGVSVPYAMVNLVCCIPKNEDTGAKFEEPPRDSVLACRPRLVEFLKLCKPKVLINVGQCATLYNNDLFSDEYDLGLTITSVHNIIHPAAILRMKVHNKGLAIQRATIAIAEATEGL